MIPGHAGGDHIGSEPLGEPLDNRKSQAGTLVANAAVSPDIVPVEDVG